MAVDTPLCAEPEGRMFDFTICIYYLTPYVSNDFVCESLPRPHIDVTPILIALRQGTVQACPLQTTSIGDGSCLTRIIPFAVNHRSLIFFGLCAANPFELSGFKGHCFTPNFQRRVISLPLTKGHTNSKKKT